MKSILKNKKAQEINITTIIIVILAVIALVVLVLGFTMGWNQLWQKVTGAQNVTQGTSADWKVVECNNKCSVNDKDGFCNAGCFNKATQKVIDSRISCSFICE